MNNNKIYIVMGYINESGDESTWVEELFEDQEQANACSAYLNLTNTQNNVTFYVDEHDGFCEEDFVSLLDTGWQIELEDLEKDDINVSN